MFGVDIVISMSFRYRAISVLIRAVKNARLNRYFIMRFRCGIIMIRRAQFGCPRIKKVCERAHNHYNDIAAKAERSVMMRLCVLANPHTRKSVCNDVLPNGSASRLLNVDVVSLSLLDAILRFTWHNETHASTYIPLSNSHARHSAHCGCHSHTHTVHHVIYNEHTYASKARKHICIYAHIYAPPYVAVHKQHDRHQHHHTICVVA